MRVPPGCVVRPNRARGAVGAEPAAAGRAWAGNLARSKQAADLKESHRARANGSWHYGNKGMAAAPLLRMALATAAQCSGRVSDATRPCKCCNAGWSPRRAQQGHRSHLLYACSDCLGPEALLEVGCVLVPGRFVSPCAALLQQGRRPSLTVGETSRRIRRRALHMHLRALALVLAACQPMAVHAGRPLATCTAP